MWRPAERIKYQPQPGAWPDRKTAEAARLFSPVAIGPVTLEQRTWVPAMVPWRATEDGHVTPELLAWYQRFAKGRPGALVVEATGIRDIPSGPLLRIGHDRYLPGLKQLVETVREASAGHTRVFIQLIDFLRINRRAPAEKYFNRFLHITPEHRKALGEQLGEDEIRAALLQLDDEALRQVLSKREYETYAMGYRERVDDLHLPHIRELPQVLPGLFAAAAQRAEAAGFDGVELHYAHAYTMASFLSAHNRRDDGYGKTLEGRVRLPLEVLAAVRKAVSPSMAVGCRYLTEDCVDGGMSVDEACYFGVELARAGMDFLSLSRGGKFEDAKQPKVGAAAYPYTGRSGYECMPQYISDEQGPFGRNLSATARIRQAVRGEQLETPVVAAGGIHGFSQAEQVLQSGEADVIAAARQTLADPDWFLKARLGLGDQVRLCLYTNYCEALDTRHKQVTCELWDREHLDEPGILKSHDGKRRLEAPSWSIPIKLGTAD
ncbi:MAG TPA: NADH:flavin oxidoreductase [Xanthomonadales bacterium]|nr:NADH:flavin oxidoreductase [Xanthomonadales bacterium]